MFIIGCGALGCKFVKNLAVMGVSCNSRGKVTADENVIKKSNLSRQFLFRDRNIGQEQSTIAAAAATNPQLCIEAFQNRVGPKTEHIFYDAFWKNPSVIFNALDSNDNAGAVNANACPYVNQRCLYFKKPLLEPGTLGAKTKTQMVIPQLTEICGSLRDSFPHNINHCLKWARSEFEGLFKKMPAEVNAFSFKSK